MSAAELTRKLLTTTASLCCVPGDKARLPRVRELYPAAPHATDAFSYAPHFFVRTRVPADWQLPKDVTGSRAHKGGLRRALGDRWRRVTVRPRALERMQAQRSQEPDASLASTISNAF